MTEEEWAKIRWCRDAFTTLDPHQYDRKSRLFVVACCRRCWHCLPDSQARVVIELSERFADDMSLYTELLQSISQLESLWPPSPSTVAQYAAAIPSADYQTSANKYWLAVEHIADIQVDSRGNYSRPILRTEALWQEQFAQLRLLRDIVGNPFRSVAFAPEWRTSTTVALAESMYTAREFGNMPILADALEEAGCDNADILTHCRNPDGVHVRGCWVVDLVLGKS